MYLTPYIKGNSIEQTFRLHKIANNGFDSEARSFRRKLTPYSFLMISDLKLMPDELNDAILNSYSDCLGPFITGMKYTELFHHNNARFCPECLKEQRDPLYHRLACFDRCLEHDIPLIARCPECGLKLERNKNHNYDIWCPRCKKYFGTISPEEAVYYSFKGKDNTSVNGVFNTPETDIAAWYLTTDENEKEYKCEEPEIVSKFLCNYFLNGKRGEPTFSIRKDEATKLKYYYDEYQNKRLHVLLNELEDKIEGEPEHDILRTMRFCVFRNFYLMPNNTFRAVEEIDNSISRLKIDERIKQYMIYKLERLFRDRYFELMKPLVDDLGFYRSEDLIVLYPSLVMTMLIFETKDSFDVYALMDAKTGVRDNVEQHWFRLSAHIQEYIKELKKAQ